MTQRQSRVLFTRLQWEWMRWFYEEFQPEHRDAEIAFDETRVVSPRPVWGTNGRETLPDALHRRGSRHHDGCAADTLLYVSGVYVTDGDHPYWQAMRRKAEELGLSNGAAWGDANHNSLRSEDGRM